VYLAAQKAWELSRQVNEMKAAVTAAVGDNKDADLTKAVTAFNAKLTAIAGAQAGGRRGGGGGGGGFRGAGGPPAAPSFALVSGALVRELGTLDSGDMAPNEPTRKSCEAALKQYQAVLKSWQTLNDKDLVEFNKVLAKNNIKPIEPATITK
jgi:hypothetical protein